MDKELGLDIFPGLAEGRFRDDPGGRAVTTNGLEERIEFIIQRAFDLIQEEEDERGEGKNASSGECLGRRLECVTQITRIKVFS